MVIVLDHVSNGSSRLGTLAFQAGRVNYLPHLTLDESQLLNDSVSHTSKGDRVWPSRVVVGAVDVVIPHLSVAIQSSNAMAIPPDALSTEQPGAALVLVANGEGVVEPVLDVLVPQ